MGHSKKTKRKGRVVHVQYCAELLRPPTYPVQEGLQVSSLVPAPAQSMRHVMPISRRKIAPCAVAPTSAARCVGPFFGAGLLSTLFCLPSIMPGILKSSYPLHIRELVLTRLDYSKA